MKGDDVAGSNNTILFTGGFCATSSLVEDTLEWDGANWTKIDLTLTVGRFLGEAMTYDPDHQNVVLFGGAPGVGVFLSTPLPTPTRSGRRWAISPTRCSFAPRLRHRSVHNVIYLYGGLNDSTPFTDFWSYSNGLFQPLTAVSQPSDCSLPLAAFDTDRQKVVMFCSEAPHGSTTVRRGRSTTPRRPLRCSRMEQSRL